MLICFRPLVSTEDHFLFHTLVGADSLIVAVHGHFSLYNLGTLDSLTQKAQHGIINPDI